MTRDEAKQLLPIIQAYSEGKEIEYLCGGEAGWRVITDLAFFPPSLYRIKPEPVECWAVVDKDGCVFSSRDTRESAEAYTKQLFAKYRVIQMREVI